MKIIKILAASTFFSICSTSLFAQINCDLPISIIVNNSNGNLSDEVASFTENRLCKVVNTLGVITGTNIGQFAIVPLVDIIDKSFHAGPPIQIVNKLGVTLYLVDIANKTKFSSVYFELDGVGNNETKSLKNAINQLSPYNKHIKNFVETGKERIIEYYNKNYKNILAEAKRKAELQQYEEALALSNSIPTCSLGGDESTMVGLEIYIKYRDIINLKKLNKARALWATKPSADCAAEVCAILAEIDPEAKAYSEAQELFKEVKEQVKLDIDFEMREKYYNKISIQKQTISAMRDIGIKNGFERKTINLNWIR